MPASWTTGSRRLDWSQLSSVRIPLAVCRASRLPRVLDSDLVPQRLAANELLVRRERYALCIMCIGAGQGVAMAIRRRLPSAGTFSAATTMAYQLWGQEFLPEEDGADQESVDRKSTICTYEHIVLIWNGNE